MAERKGTKGKTTIYKYTSLVNLINPWKERQHICLPLQMV